MGVMNYHTARSAGMLSPTLDDPHFGNLSETRNTQNHVCKFHIYYILRLICKPAPSPHVWITEMVDKDCALRLVPIVHTFRSAWMGMGPSSSILPENHRPLLYPDAIRLLVMLGACLTSDVMLRCNQKVILRKNIVRKNSGGKSWAESDSSYLTFPFNTKENNWMGTKLEMRRRVKKEYTRHPGASLMPIKFDE